jgi:hypothetical protein
MVEDTVCFVSWLVSIDNFLTKALSVLPEKISSLLPKPLLRAALFDQFKDGLQDFIDYLLFPGLKLFGHTGLHVFFQEQPGHPVQGRLGRGNLVQNIITVNPAFDHPLDAPNLPLNPVDPADQILYSFLIVMALSLTRFHPGVAAWAGDFQFFHRFLLPEAVFSK